MMQTTTERPIVNWLKTLPEGTILWHTGRSSLYFIEGNGLRYLHAASLQYIEIDDLTWDSELSASGEIKIVYIPNPNC